MVLYLLQSEEAQIHRPNSFTMGWGGSSGRRSFLQVQCEVWMSNPRLALEQMGHLKLMLLPKLSLHPWC